MEFTCCLCGKKFEGYGNNPWPLKQSGRCCDDCNEAEVIPARIYLARENKGGKKE